MREILFKAKRLDNGEWVEGFPFEYSGVGTCIGTEPLSVNDYGEIYQNCYSVIDPKTLCRYTGLTDKNGVKIFEGDKVTGKFNGELIFGNIVFGVEAAFFIERRGMYGIGLNNSSDWLDVIGNIHDKEDEAE